MSLGFLGGMFDAGMTLAGFQHAEEMQDDAQAYNYFRWQEQTAREDTAHRREVHDLKMAGLNPMLTMMHRGAPSSAAAASPAGSTPNITGRFTESLQSASQIRVNDAIEERTRAEADKVRAEEQEIIARTPAHAVSIDKMRQQIQESIVLIKKMEQETSTSAFTAQNIAQQTINLREAVHQIRATVQQLQAQKFLTGAETALAHSRYDEVRQRIRADLPGIERALKQLEEYQRQLELPGQQQTADVQRSIIGNLSAIMKALNPLQGLLK